MRISELQYFRGHTARFLTIFCFFFVSDVDTYNTSRWNCTKNNINLNSAAIRWWPHTYVYTMCTTQLGFFGIMFNPMHDLLSSYNNFFRRNRFHRSISRNLICLENDSNYYLKSNQIRLLGNEFIVKQRQSINFQFFFRNVIIKLLDSTDVNF